MLFLYGGGFVEGAASFIVYDGATDVRLTKDVIIVTANYRMSAFGFAAAKALQNEVWASSSCSSLPV